MALLEALLVPGERHRSTLWEPSRLAGLLLDPMKPERIDHLVAAVAALGITLVALVYSAVRAIPLLMN